MNKGHWPRQDTTEHNDREKGAGAGAGEMGAAESVDELLPPQFGGSALGGDLLFLCAEPGMGKTYLTTGLMRKAQEEGHPVYRYEYSGLAADVACKKIVRNCREIKARVESTGDAFVVFDGMPASDEAQSRREALALEKLKRKGARVVVCLRPEAEQLLDQFDQPNCLHCSDLLFRQLDEESLAMELTGGIPALVMALRADRAMGDRPEHSGSRYAAALAELVDKTLRKGLSDEEWRIRFAMILLGQGTMEEVAMVAGRCDEEQMQWLARDVPLLGIDPGKGGFSCHGLNGDRMLATCGSVLRAHAANEPGLIMRACGSLAARDDVRRSAIVSRLCASERDHISVCVAWGVAYVGVGEAQLVLDAVKRLRDTCAPLGERGLMSEAAALSVLGTVRQVDIAWEGLGKLQLSGSMERRLLRKVQLLGICRDILRNPRQAPQFMTAESNDAVGLACLDHLRAVRLMASGHFEEAYAIMTNEMLVCDPHSIPEAYVCDDLYLSLLLSGGAPDLKERNLFRRTDEFFMQPVSSRVQAYHAAVVAMPAILMSSDHEAGALEDAVTKAERSGDAFFQAICLSVCAIADIRTRAYSRAHVRAARASELARAMGEEYLASSAELVDAIAREMLGERGPFGIYCEQTSRPEGLALVGRILAQAAGELNALKARFSIPKSTPCPRSVLWAINLLMGECANIWETLGDAVPSTWTELLESIRNRQRGDELGNSTASKGRGMALGRGGQIRLGEGRTEAIWGSRPKGHVRVSLLGGFEVMCDGRPLPDGLFERRRARDLVTLLAIVSGHKMRRYQAIEVLWPNDDYYRGPRRLYEATGEARKHLGSPVHGTSAIMADRTQGTIGLDTAIVSCDVDDFEREARLALTENGDDFDILDHAQRMAEIYSTGPDEHLYALGELVAERVDELRSLYVDAAVAAGEAALRLGKTRLAVRYGTDAHRINEMREDVVILLARSLKAAGRGFEIADLYRRYSRRLIESKGVPPSASMRTIIERLMGSGLDTGAEGGLNPMGV